MRPSDAEDSSPESSASGGTVRPRELEKDDRISIDQEGLSDATFRVSSVEVEDIGITEVVAVGLVADAQSASATESVGSESDAEVSGCGVGQSTDSQAATRETRGEDTYSLTGATADSSFTLEHRESGEEWQVFAQFIALED